MIFGQSFTLSRYLTGNIDGYLAWGIKEPEASVVDSTYPGHMQPNPKSMLFLGKLLIGGGLQRMMRLVTSTVKKKE